MTAQRTATSDPFKAHKTFCKDFVYAHKGKKPYCAICGRICYGGQLLRWRENGRQELVHLGCDKEEYRVG